ncbi:MAG: hypothetical protein AB1589_18795 [Cyanobacteriota bacterium]
MNVIKDYITQDFDLLDGNLAPTKAIDELKKNYGVVVDQEKNPQALVVAEDLERAANRGASSLLHPKSGLPPTVLVGCQVKMQDLADPATMTLFKVGARGAIALDDEGNIVGVLPVEALNQYLDNTPVQRTISELAPSGGGGDTGLPGALQLPNGIVICTQCGHPNNVPFLDPEFLPRCKNPNQPPHTIKLAE